MSTIRSSVNELNILIQRQALSKKQNLNLSMCSLWETLFKAEKQRMEKV